MKIKLMLTQKARLLLALVVLLLTSAFAPFFQEGVVEIPEDFSLALTAAMLALVTAGFVYLFEKTGLDLRGYATTISGTISVWILVELQGYLNTLPDSLDVWVLPLLKILAIIMGSIGVLRLIKGKAAREQGLF